LKGNVWRTVEKETSYLVLERKCVEAYGRETSYVVLERKCVEDCRKEMCRGLTEGDVWRTVERKCVEV
jgi:hypothetical protein